jgi:DNA-binding beta-propeller fold protein YncE
MTALGLVSLVLLTSNCAEEEVLRVEPEPSPEPALFVVNSLAETLSRILLDEGTAVRDALALGSAPNAIVLGGASGNLGYVVNTASNQVGVIDLDQMILLRSIDLGPGSSPFALALAGSDGYVSNFIKDEVVRLDLESREMKRRIPAGRGPEGLLLVPDRAGDPERGTLYVAASGYTDEGYRTGEVVCVSVPADTVRHRITVGINPQKLALAPDGTVHVVCTGDYGPREGKVFVIDRERLAVIDSVAIGGSPAAVLVLESGQGVTAGFYGGLRYYDRSTGAAFESRALAGEQGLSALAQDSIAGRVLLYVTDFDDSLVHVVDIAADSLVTSYPTGHGPVDLVVRR